MNRILFESCEIADGRATFGGERARHVLEILHGTIGQTLKTGEVDGLVGNSEIVAIAGVETEEPLITVRVSHTEASLPPWVDLILAPPRPRVFKRLLPQLAALGVGRIILVGAQKVEKDFWGATLLKPENYRPLLIDGLMQAGTTALPTLEIWKSFGRFLREGLPYLKHARRLVAHPYGASATVACKTAAAPAGGRVLLAIGPEGGWTEAEVAKLEAAGFLRESLGPRILRTDTATVALLARLMV